MTYSDERTEQIKEFFALDRFATEAAGIEIVKADDNYALCRMTVEEKHKNANGLVMGGAIFTLADFTFAVATNMEETMMTVSLCSQIQYLRPCSGGILYGESEILRLGRSSCVAEINIRDDKGSLIAKATINGLRTPKPEYK